MKKMIIILIVLVVIVVVGFIVMNKFGVGVDKEKIVADYLRNNISEISPEKEVLGGKFYITSIVFGEDDSFIVEYEDGHIALKAKGKYKIEEQVKIYNFIIVSH